MLSIPNQSQMSGHGRSMGLAPAAACRVQAPAIVTPGTQDVNTTRKGCSHALAGSSPSHALRGLVDEFLLTRLGAGFGRRPFQIQFRSRVFPSFPQSVIAQSSTARGGCLSLPVGSRQISRCGFLPRNRVRRGGSAFVAAPTSRPLTFQPGHHVLQDITDVPENHSVKTLSVCRLSENDNTREAPENDRKAFGEFRNV